MKLIDILEKINFRLVNDNCKYEHNINDTDIIRIYFDDFDDSKWFEFGVIDWNANDNKIEIINEIFNKKFLNKEVNDIRSNNDLNIIEIFLK